MLLSKLKIATAVLLVASVVGLSVGRGVYRTLAAEPAPAAKQARPLAPTAATTNEEDKGQAAAPAVVAPANDKPKPSAPSDRPNIRDIPVMMRMGIVRDANGRPKEPPAPSQEATAHRLGVARLIQSYYQRECDWFVEALQNAEAPEAKADLLKTAPLTADYAMRAAFVVAQHPKDEAAFEALTWLTRFLGHPGAMKALQKEKLDPLALLAEHHLNNPKLADLCQTLSVDRPGAEAFLRAAADKSTAAEVRGRAGWNLATAFLRRSKEADRPETSRQELAKTAEEMLERLRSDPAMAEARVGRKTFKDMAEGKLNEVRFLDIGKPLPAVSGEGLDGKTQQLSDYQGKVVVLDVWYTGCGPCLAMIPHEREMVKRLEGKPFALVSVSCDEKKETLTKFLAKTPMPWAHWWVGRDSKLATTLNIQYYPTIYVLDAKGVIRHKDLRGEALEAAVNALLKEMEQKTER